MSITLLAQKEFTDSMRSRGLWAATALLTVIMSASVFLPAVAIDNPDPASVPQYMLTPISTFVSITALVLGYLAIAGERDTGSIKTLFGLPYTRSDVVAAKYLGRSAVISVAIFVSFLVAAVVGFAVYDSFPISAYIQLTLLTAVFGIVYVGIAVAISAGSPSRSRAMPLAIGVFFIFELLWSTLLKVFHYVVTFGDFPGPEPAAWYIFVQRLSPADAFSTAVAPLIPGDAVGIQISGSGGASEGASSGGNAAPTLAERLGGELPFYLEDWFALVILACWLVIPIVIGYIQFKRADLG